MTGRLRDWISELSSTTDISGPSDGPSLGLQRRTRNRRAAATGVASVTARGLLLGATLISVPLSVGYLGVERYGIFVALTSLTAMFMFADLGLGNGLMNIVSDANGRSDQTTVQRSVSSAYVMLLGVALVLLVIGAAAYPLIDWAVLFGTTPRTASETGPAAAVLIVLYVVGLPLGLAERVRLGFQEGFVNSLIAIFGVLGGLLGLVVAIVAEATLPWLVLAVSLPPLAALGFNAALLFARDHPSLRPRWSFASREMVLRLARVGFLFFALQLAVVVAFQSDVLVAAALLGPEAAATYAVTIRVFMIVPSLIGLVLMALWPAYTEAIARGDRLWVRQTLRRSVIGAAVASSASSVALIVAGPSVIRFLTGDLIEPPVGLVVGAAVWAVANASLNAVTMLFNAASVVKFQVVTATVMAIGSIGLSIVLARVVGLPGIVWGTLIAYVILSAIPVVIYLPRVLHRLDAGKLSNLSDA